MKALYKRARKLRRGEADIQLRMGEMDLKLQELHELGVRL